MSLVEVQPSTVIWLKLRLTASCSARFSVLGSTAASVVSTASMVAMLGASMAAPLAIPPTEKPRPGTTTCLDRVSVVMIAWAAAWPASAPPARRPTRVGIPAATLSICSGMPMSPVEQTSTSEAAQPISPATSAHMRSACSSPARPVAALALPLLITTATAWPADASRWRRLTLTGAAVAWLVVKVAAAGTGRPSAVATRDRSGAPVAFNPQAAPLATKPLGAVTLMDTGPRSAGR